MHLNSETSPFIRFGACVARRDAAAPRQLECNDASEARSRGANAKRVLRVESCLLRAFKRDALVARERSCRRQLCGKSSLRKREASGNETASRSNGGAASCCCLEAHDRAACIRRSVFVLLLNFGCVFPLRREGPHDRKALVAQKEDSAGLWPVHTLHHSLNCGKRFGVGGI